MKKLLIVVVGVCAACAVQAASIKWFADGIKADNTGSAKAKGYVAFSFIQAADSSSSEETLAKIWSLDEAVAALSQKGDRSNFDVEKGKAVQTGNVSLGMLNLKPYTDDAWSADTEPVLSYAIVFNAATVADATHYLVLRNGDAKVLETKFAEQSDEVAAQFGSQAGNLNYVKIGEPAPVPEPTSGVLLVLGLAGLALRRRTA